MKDKQFTSVSGEKSRVVRKEIGEAMFVDGVNLSHSSLTTHELIDEIDNRKTEKLTNCESVRSLAKSVSEITTIISRPQKKMTIYLSPI